MSEDTLGNKNDAGRREALAFSDLLPCPFCGVTPKVTTGTDFFGEPVYYIYCKGPGCSVQPGVKHVKTKPSYAADIWNARAG